MTKKKNNSNLGLTLSILCLCVYLSTPNSISANYIPIPTSNIKLSLDQLTLHSYSFTAQKRSGFSLGPVSVQTERGLTIIHFNTGKKIEYRTFDTHSSEEAAVELVDILKRMIADKATFAILAHDSAAKGLAAQTETLRELSFLKLSTLKNRQAYLMHNFEDSLYESVDDISISKTLSVPSNISDDTIYFPKIKYEFEPNKNRYIAHAGGEVNGIRSTNSRQALDESYQKGFRLFELDIVETSDGKLVAAHDWGMWARFTDYSGALPPTLAEFKKYKIYGDYNTLDFDDINAWFTAHPDAILVTDKINDPSLFASNFVDKSRLFMELFSFLAIEEGSQNGINTIISQEALMAIKGDKLNFLKINNIQYVAVSRRIIANQTKLLLKLRDGGIKVYVYNVNFDAGKDEQYVQENEIGLVYGMYADKWIFDKISEDFSR